MMKTVKIELNDEYYSGRVSDANTGELIRGITSIDIHARPGSLPQIDLGIVLVDASVNGKARFLAFCPKTDKLEQVKKIEFMNGVEIDYAN